MSVSTGKKIAFFLPDLSGGGAERVFVTIANEFSLKGFEVNLVLSHAHGSYLQEVNKQVVISDLKSRKVRFSSKGLALYLAKENPSILFSTLDHANIIAVLASRIADYKGKVILRESNTLSISYRSNNSLKGKLMLLLIRLFYPLADLIIAPSKGVKQDLISFLKIPEAKVKVIYNPLDYNKIQEKAKDIVDHIWFNENSVPIIISAGRLEKQKDFHTLIRAFVLVREKFESRLVILGEGEERQKLEEIANDLGITEYLWMPGYVDNPYKFFSKASVFVVSSVFEGFPNVLLEAMACGASIVSTDCRSGPREILDEGKYGRLVKVGDVAELANAINETIKDPFSKSMLVERAKLFSLERIVGDYIKLI